MMDTIAYRFQRVSFVFAAGNSGDTNTPMPSSPSTAKNAIPVGASFSGSHNYLSMFTDAIKNAAAYALTCIVSFSSHGPLPDGRMSPLVYSPGVYEIVPYGYLNPVAGHNQYFRLSGTSFSTPNMAGFIAEYQSSFKSRNAGLTPLGGLTKAMLIAISTPMNFQIMAISKTGSIPYRMAQLNEMGFGVPQGEYTEETDQEVEGLLESGSMVAYCYHYQFDVELWNTSCLSSSSSPSSSSVCVDAQLGGNTVSIGMSWHDVPAIAYVSHPLINDLNALVFMNYQLVGVLDDAVNPHEHIVITNPSSHPWALDGSTVLRIVVYEKDNFIEDGPQPFGIFIRQAPMIAGLSFGPGYECGICSGVEKVLCDLSSNLTTVDHYQYCNVTDGQMTDCLPTTNENATITCDPDFYYEDGVCKCVLGFSSSTTSSPKICLPTNEGFAFQDPLYTDSIELDDEGGGGGGPTSSAENPNEEQGISYRYGFLLVIIFFIL